MVAPPEAPRKQRTNGKSEGPEPSSLESSDPMIEAGAPSTASLACGRSVVPTPPGVVMVAPHEVPRNAERAPKRRAAPAVMGESSAASSEEVRVRNQVGKESARPRALLYVVPEVCASATWPFMKASPHPDKPGIPKSGCSYRWAKRRAAPRRGTRKARPGAL